MSTAKTAYDMLRASRLAAELSDDQCRTLAARIAVRELAEGEVLVREGGSDNHLYGIASGTLAVARTQGTPEEVRMFTLGPQDTVGELSFLDDNVHYASVVARSRAVVFGLERRQLEAMLDTDPHIVYRLMRAIVSRVHQAQHRLSAQAAELQNYVFKQHGRY